MKTLKQYINDWFEDKVSYDDVHNIYNDRDFWSAWDKLQADIDLGGIQWCFEWHMEEPPLTEERSKFINEAIDNYIKKNIQPKYVQY